MSATRAQREGADFCRDDQDAKARGLGHTLTWTLGPNSHRKGCEYHWLGKCEDCAAEVSAGSCWSSCPGVRDARRDRCSGPGTAVLTEIETARVGELAAGAVSGFGARMRRGGGSR